jgi:hypothetical protein
MRLAEEQKRHLLRRTRMSRTLLRVGALLFAATILGAATLHAGLTSGCAPHAAATSPEMNAAAPKPPAPKPTVAATAATAPPSSPAAPSNDDNLRYLPASKAGPFFPPQKAAPPPPPPPAAQQSSP